MAFNQKNDFNGVTQWRQSALVLYAILVSFFFQSDQKVSKYFKNTSSVKE